MIREDLNDEDDCGWGSVDTDEENARERGSEKNHRKEGEDNTG